MPFRIERAGVQISADTAEEIIALILALPEPNPTPRRPTEEPQKPAARPPDGSDTEKSVSRVGAEILAFLVGKPPITQIGILTAIRDARKYHITRLIQTGRLSATGQTSGRRYYLPSAPSDTMKAPATRPKDLEKFDVVFDGSKGQSLSGYQQKPGGGR